MRDVEVKGREVPAKLHHRLDVLRLGRDLGGREPVKSRRSAAAAVGGVRFWTFLRLLGNAISSDKSDLEQDES